VKRLEGKIAIVTGAARGIGEATACRFVDEGAVVWVTDIDEEAGRQVAARLGERAVFARLDVRRDEDWRAVIGGVGGAIDVLVNNAGITGFADGVTVQDPENCTLEGWRRVHETNLDGVFLGCKHAIAAMKARGGSIVNVSSRSGVVGIGFAVAYASSKAAVRNHTKSVAMYCASMGYPIRCNSVHPAAVLTPMWEPVLGAPGPEREARVAAFVAETPMRRFGTAGEIAGAIAFLASDDAAYMTGAEVHLDGGLLAGSAAVPKAPTDSADRARRREEP
jgi:NAD(P)-dependent dehydrogenase (short-subunit alcohol dehydrogenase family)